MVKKQKKYKLKTYKAAAKRFRVTGSGKVMRTKGGKSHLRRRKAKRSKAQFDVMQEALGCRLVGLQLVFFLLFHHEPHSL